MANGTLTPPESDWSAKIKAAIAPKSVTNPDMAANPALVVGKFATSSPVLDAAKRVAQGYTAPLPDKAVPRILQPVERALAAPEGSMRAQVAQGLSPIAGIRQDLSSAIIYASPAPIVQLLANFLARGLVSAALENPVRTASEVSGYAPARRALDAAGNVKAFQDPLKKLGAAGRTATEGGMAALGALGDAALVKDGVKTAARAMKALEALKPVEATAAAAPAEIAAIADPQYSKTSDIIEEAKKLYQEQGGLPKKYDSLISEKLGVSAVSVRSVVPKLDLSKEGVAYKDATEYAKKSFDRLFAHIQDVAANNGGRLPDTYLEDVAVKTGYSPNTISTLMSKARAGMYGEEMASRAKEIPVPTFSANATAERVREILREDAANGTKTPNSEILRRVNIWRDSQPGLDPMTMNNLKVVKNRVGKELSASQAAPKTPLPYYEPGVQEIVSGLRPREVLTNPSTSTVGKMLREQSISGQANPVRYWVDEQGNAHVWNSDYGFLHDDVAQGLKLDPAKAIKGTLETPDDIQEFNLAVRNARRNWAKQNGYSRVEFPGLGSSVDDLTKAVRKSWGGDTKKLMDAGRIRVVESVEDLPPLASGEAHPSNVSAMYDRNSGMTWVVADNTPLSAVKGKILHEIGEHHGLEDMLGAERYGALQSQMKKLELAGNKDVVAAYEAARKYAAKPEQIDKEAIAYLLEAKPNAPISVKFIQAIREWFNRNFGTVKSFMRGREVNLTTEDIRQLGVASLRRTASRADEAVGANSVDPMYGLGAMEDKGARTAWANSKEVKKGTSNSEFIDKQKNKFKVNYHYDFPVGTSKVRVEFARSPLPGAWDVTFWNPEKSGWSRFEAQPGAFGENPSEAFGKIAAVMERFAAEHDPSILKFTGSNDRLSKLYSQMLGRLAPEGAQVWDVSNPRVYGHQFVVSKRTSGDALKRMFGNATPLTKPLTSAEIKAKEAAVRATLYGPLSYSRAEQVAQEAARPRKWNEKVADFIEGKSPRRPEPQTPEQRRARGAERLAELVGGIAGGATGGAIAANSMIVSAKKQRDREAALQAERAARTARLNAGVKKFRFERDNPVESIQPGSNTDEMIRTIAQRQGVPAEFLKALISKESGGNANAEAHTSTAIGSTQFIEDTWKDLLRQDGKELGFTGDPDSPEALELRRDPRWAASAAALHAKRNAERLQQKIGRAPTQGEVSLAHFLGATAAAQVIKADPATVAAKLLPKAAQANANVFYIGGDKSKPRTVAQVIDLQTKGFSKEPFGIDAAEVGRKVLNKPANPREAAAH